MPIERCQSEGKSGYRWGKSGKCYVGPGAREKAAEQGRAIERQKHMKSEHTEFLAYSFTALWCNWQHA